VLNELLADSMVLYEHYRKEHLLADPSDRDLQDLLEMYARDRRELIERIIERVQALGGTATSPRQVVELTVIARPPKGAADVPEMLSRLIEVHERVIGRIRDAIAAIATSGDEKTSDLLKAMLRRHEREAWSLAELVVDTTALSA
jgi:starvation-inducible DNA-binding protein